MKISVLMPTYNDRDSICETFDSLIKQTYKNWELIIVDDGSTDDTENVVKNYKLKNDKNNQIRYIKQTNKDQLNALKNGCQYITGDYVWILHSDDLLANEFVFEKAINYLKENPNLDGIIADLIVIDEKSNITGKQFVKNYVNKKYVVPLQLLFLGRNLYVDFAFHKKETFLTNVYNNYLNWNGPFWLNATDGSILNIKKVDFNFQKYRVFEGNYINNEIGLLNVINGELRLVLNLMKLYDIPLYKVQYYIYALFRKLKIDKIYRPIYFKRETKNKDKVIKFVLNKRINDYLKYESLSSIYYFFKNYQNREILVNNVIDIYMGSDMRIFNKKLVNNELSDFYKYLFKEMKEGFNVVIVPNQKVKEEFEIVAKFLGIYNYITIKEVNL